MRQSFLKLLFLNNSGATAIEYGLIAGLISVVLLPAMNMIRTPLIAIFNTVGSALGG